MDDPGPAHATTCAPTPASTACEGVGVSEAPRGTLFHDYTWTADGLLQKVNLIVATGQNNLAMNRTVAQIARHYVRGRASRNRCSTASSTASAATTRA